MIEGEEGRVSRGTHGDSHDDYETRKRDKTNGIRASFLFFSPVL